MIRGQRSRSQGYPMTITPSFSRVSRWNENWNVNHTDGYVNMATKIRFSFLFKIAWNWVIILDGYKIGKNQACHFSGLFVCLFFSIFIISLVILSVCRKAGFILSANAFWIGYINNTGNSGGRKRKHIKDHQGWVLKNGWKWQRTHFQ